MIEQRRIEAKILKHVYDRQSDREVRHAWKAWPLMRCCTTTVMRQHPRGDGGDRLSNRLDRSSRPVPFDPNDTLAQFPPLAAHPVILEICNC